MRIEEGTTATFDEDVADDDTYMEVHGAFDQRGFLPICSILRFWFYSCVLGLLFWS